VFAPIDTWLREHLYAVVLAGAVVDAVGIPFPGRIVLITAGSVSSAAAEHGASVAIVIALATVGTVAGDHVWYILGRLYGRRLFTAYGRLIRLSEAKLKAADRILRRFGGLALVIARLAATLRVLIVPLAVSRGMSYRRFLAFDLLGALVWSASFVWLGWAAGTVDAQSGLTATLMALGVLAFASVVLGVVVRRWLVGRVRVS
jgi:membrane protein DedA with SNARE-associated domain